MNRKSFEKAARDQIERDAHFNRLREKDPRQQSGKQEKRVLRDLNQHDLSKDVALNAEDDQGIHHDPNETGDRLAIARLEVGRGEGPNLPKKRRELY